MSEQKKVEAVVDYPEAPAGLALGYLKLDRPGDVPAVELTCRKCGQPLDFGIWLEVIARGHGGVYLGAPLCGECAVPHPETWEELQASKAAPEAETE